MWSAEDIKRRSRGLRGALREKLAAPANAAAALDEAEIQIMRFHGIYRQMLRERRTVAAAESREGFLVRVRLPGGALTAAQYAALDEAAEHYGDGVLRLTGRQGVQFHRVKLEHLRPCLALLHAAGLSTWNGCGDVVRNVTAPAAPYAAPGPKAAQALAQRLSLALAARGEAYEDVWFNRAESLAPPAERDERIDPLYGDAYLPRKLKITAAALPYNDVDAYANDLCFVVHENYGSIAGCTVLAGGGMGTGRGRMAPAVARPLFFIRLEDVEAVALAVIEVFRLFGNRADRGRARLRHLLAERGFDWFKVEILKRFKGPVGPAWPLSWLEIGEPLGRCAQGDGRWFLGVRVETGRVADDDRAQYRAAFRAALARFPVPLRLTVGHNVLFCDLEERELASFENILAAHGVRPAAALTAARRNSTACPALPTCGRAFAESERIFPGLMDRIDVMLREYGLAAEPLAFRLTGCPNGCVCPYTADLAWVGVRKDRYDLYVGGSPTVPRLAAAARRDVPAAELAESVQPFLREFAENRRPHEAFHDYWMRRNAAAD